MRLREGSTPLLAVVLWLAATGQLQAGDSPRVEAGSPAAGSSEAGQAPEAQELPERAATHEFGIWIGGGTLSNLGGLEDHETDGRHVALLGLRYSRVLLRREAYTLQYYADLIPVALETKAIVEGEGTGALAERPTVYGAGLSPLGLRLVFRPSARVRPFLGASGGFMLFSDDIPLPGAKRFTYTGDAELGAEVRLAKGHALLAGIRFHHVSNANTGDVNPGLNTFALYAGFSVSR